VRLVVDEELDDDEDADDVEFVAVLLLNVLRRDELLLR